MNLSDFPAVSGLVTTRDRIRTDLAILEDATRFNFVIGGIDLWRGSYPEERLNVLKAGDAPRQWADDRLFQQFANDMRVLLRGYLIKDLECCDRRLAELGVAIDDNKA